MMLILGIESSCDETAAALVRASGGRFEILSNAVSSQIKLHQPFGGVVPELAAREHLRNILPVVKEALGDFKPQDIYALAVTVGPGLMPALMIGVETAKALAYAWGKPLYPVNHMEAHVYANWIDHSDGIEFPAVGLIISGGHTELVLIKGPGKYKLLGQTLDDATGECFDKVAKMLKIGYPGGPLIEKTALTGNPAAYKFPRPLLDKPNFDFSFSGLKTSVLYFLQKNFPEAMGAGVATERGTSEDGAGKGAVTGEARIGEKDLADICASFQAAVFEVLIQKTLRAAKKYKVQQILLAGGVAANNTLKQQMLSVLEKPQDKKTGDQRLIYPELKYCTDNAAMVAVAGYFESLRGTAPESVKIKVNSQLDIT